MSTPGQRCCRWCQKPFNPRKGGRSQRYCSPIHRREFERAGRCYIDLEIAAGRLGFADLHAARTTRALVGEVTSSEEYPGSGGGQ